MNKGDVPATPLPYDDITIAYTGPLWLNLPHGSGTSAGMFNNTDWGSGLDFYINQIIIAIYSSEQLSGAFYAQLFTVVGGTDEYLISESIAGFSPVYHGGQWIFAKTWYLPILRRVAVNEPIRASLQNISGKTASFATYISGIAK